MIRQLGILWIGCLTLWLLLAGPAWLLAGETGLLDTAVAVALCLVPMTATMAWCQWTFGERDGGSAAQAPEQQLLAVLGGTGVRMVIVLVGGIGLFHAAPALHRPAFLLWVVVFYLATLTLEIVLVVRRQNGLADDLAHRSQPPQNLTDCSGPGR